MLPIVVAAVRAATSGWLPLGDNAYFAIRSRDVLGPDHPLVGAWSAGSVATGSSVNNLGPLQLDLLAPFTKIAPVAGTAIGSAAVNVMAVVAIALVVRRVAPTAVVLIALATTSLLAWTMGSALLIEPRQHHALLLPFLCFLFLCWATASGDRWMLAPTAFVASLLAQTHLTYLILVTILSIAALGGLVWSTRISDGTVDAGADRTPWWHPLRRPGLMTAVVALICWFQPLLDQFFETGNLGRILGASDGGGTAPGFGEGLRIVAKVLTRPTAWGRNGFRDFRPATTAGGASAEALGLVVIVGLLIGLAVLACRWGDRRTATLGLAAALAVISAVISATLVPGGAFGLVEGNYRWLWPISMFVATAMMASVLSAMRAHHGTVAVNRPVQWKTPGTAGVAVVAAVSIVLLAAANLATSFQVDLLRTEVAQRGAVRDLVGQLHDADVSGPVVVDRSEAGFGDPYAYPVLLQLQQDGVPFTFDNPADIARFGRGRTNRGGAARRLSLVIGGAAATDRPGAMRIAFTSPETRDDEGGAAAGPFVTAALFLTPVR